MLKAPKLRIAAAHTIAAIESFSLARSQGNAAERLRFMLDIRRMEMRSPAMEINTWNCL